MRLDLDARAMCTRGTSTPRRPGQASLFQSLALAEGECPAAAVILLAIF